MRKSTAIPLLIRHWLKGGFLVLLMGLVATPAVAVLSNNTGQIRGQAPTVTGSLQALFPDGETVLADNTVLGMEQIPNQFRVSSSTAGLVLQDADGDSGLSALVDTDQATLTWKHDGTELSPAQLAAPFGNNFPDGTLTLEVSAPVTVSSATGLPTTAAAQIFTTTYTVVVRIPVISQGNLTVVIDNAQADGTATNAVQALVTDAQGNPVAGQSVNFSATNGASVTATSATTDADGLASTTLTSTSAGSSTITATVNGSIQSVDVIFLALFNAVTANGHTFSANAGFPSTGFDQAAFTLDTNNPASEYTWSSNQPDAVSVDNSGQVVLNHAPSGAVTITATPKTGGIQQSYIFTVATWFNQGPTVQMNFSDATQWCKEQGQQLPPNALISLGANVRSIGSLWSEWGDMRSYGWGDLLYTWTSTMTEYEGHSIVNFVDLRAGLIREGVLGEDTAVMPFVCQWSL